MSGRLFAAFALGLMLQGQAFAASAQVQDKVDTEPDWLRRPRAEDILSVWPSRALRQGLGGKAVVHCKVSAQGTVFDCLIVSESPASAGFGGAALVLTTQFLFKPATKNGLPVAYDGITVPIKFETPDIETGSHLPGMRNTDFLPTRVISNPPWVTAPTYADLLAAYPTAAVGKSISGHATFDCSLKSDGHLVGCDVLNEEPKSEGFGKAGRTLMSQFSAPTTDSSGTKLAGAHVQISVSFAKEMLTGSRPTIGKPRWIELPEAEAFRQRFQPLTDSLGVSTLRATLSCTVGPHGYMVNCAVANEDPANSGMGKGALELAGQFRVSIWTAEGLPTIGGEVKLPIRYNRPLAD